MGAAAAVLQDDVHHQLVVLIAVRVAEDLGMLDRELLAGGIDGEVLDGVCQDIFVAVDLQVFIQTAQALVGHEHAHLAGVGLPGGKIGLALDDARHHIGDAVDGQLLALQVGPAEQQPRELFVQQHPVLHQVVRVQIVPVQQADRVKVEIIAPHCDHRGLTLAVLALDVDRAVGAPAVHHQHGIAADVQRAFLQPGHGGRAEGRDLLEGHHLVHRQKARDLLEGHLAVALPALGLPLGREQAGKPPPPAEAGRSGKQHGNTDKQQNALLPADLFFPLLFHGWILMTRWQAAPWSRS